MSSVEYAGKDAVADIAQTRSNPELDVVLVGGCHHIAAIPREELTDYYRGYAAGALAALGLALTTALVAAVVRVL